MFDGLGKWLGRWVRPQRRPARSRRRAGFRPLCEVLEDRRLLTTITVTTNGDGLGSYNGSALPNPTDTTLRGAIANANVGDTINFAAAVDGQTIKLVGGALQINQSLTINGVGSNVTLTGSKISLIFDVTAPTVNISGLTLLDGGGNTALGAMGAGSPIVTGLPSTAALYVGEAVTAPGIQAATTIQSIDSSSQITLTTSPVTAINEFLSFGSGPFGSGGAIYNTGSLTLSNCTITGSTSHGAGGAIYNKGTLDVIGSTLTGNRSGYGYGGAGGGGAIYNNQGTATVTNCVIGTVAQGNIAYSGYGGGLCNSQGTLTVTNSTVSGNSAQIGIGGGIYSFNGTLTVTGSTVGYNRVNGSGGDGTGGGIGITGTTTSTVTISNSTIAHNYASNYGGGINASGKVTTLTVTISGSIIANNSTPGDGGGLNNKADKLTLQDSTVSGNSAHLGGGIFNGYSAVEGALQGYGKLDLNYSQVTANYATQDGGGIDNAGGKLTVTDSTVSGNTAGSSGGGIANEEYHNTLATPPTYYGTLTVNNSTISGNHATTAGGGGIYNQFGAAGIANSTISGNTCFDIGSGIYNDTHGTLSLLSSTISGNSSSPGNYALVTVNPSATAVTLSDTIVAGNAQGSIGLGGVGKVDTGTSSYDLIGTAGYGGLTTGTNHNITGVANPKLSALGSFGGPTQTLALLPGSYAIGGGSASVPGFAATGGLDQRGFARGASVDIGAFQTQSSTQVIQVNTTTDPQGILQSGSDLRTTNNGTSAFVTVTSASYQFQASAVGSMLTITGGPSWTPGVYEIVYVQGGAATLAVPSVGTGGSSLVKGTWFINPVSRLGESSDLTSSNAVSTTGTVTVSSSSHPFTASDVGGTLNITGGSNWTPGLYKIISVSSSGVATLYAPHGVGTGSNLANGIWYIGGISQDLSTNNNGTGPGTVTVSSASFQFLASDIGDSLTIVGSSSGSSWTPGVYTISSVTAGGAAILATSTVGTGGASLSGGVWYLNGVSHVGGELHSTNTVSAAGTVTVSSSGSYKFLNSDIGADLIITGGNNWTPGVYYIQGVDAAGDAILLAPNGVGTGGTLTDGSWYLARNTASGELSLREAVNLANTSPGSTIEFAALAPGQTISLTGGQLTISATTTINPGPGASSFIISGNNLARIFDITAGTVNISYLTLSGGLATGGGGGAILNGNGCTLTLTDCIITGNTNTNGSGGGGLFNSGGTLHVNNSTVSNNNSTGGGGGGIANQGSTANLYVKQSVISGNIMSTGGASGGGIADGGGYVYVGYSTISDNQAVAFGGGGLVMINGTLKVENSTISGNRANGGDGGGLNLYSGTAHLYNTTIYGNYTGNTGNGAAISTNGIFANTTANVQLVSCTVSGNSAVQNSGGLFNCKNLGSVTLINTIVAGNTGQVGSPLAHESDLNSLGALNSTFTSNGYNAFGTIAGATITLRTSDLPPSTQVGTDLGALADNGGLVAGCPGAAGTGAPKTMALLANNPAVGAGDPALLPLPAPINKDERGVLRGVSGTVDIGAYAANIAPVLSVTAGSPQAGTAFTITVKAVNAAGQVTPGYNGTVQFTTSDTNGLVQLPANTTFNPTVNKGILNVTATLITAGTQTITVTDTGTGSIAGTLSTTVSPGPVTHFEIVGLPSTSTALLLQPVAFEGVDNFGNIGSGFAGTITFSCTDPQATVTFPGNNPPPAVPLQGFTYTFPGGPDVVTLAVAFNTNNSQTITVTSGTINYSISTTVVGASVVTPTSQTAQVVPTTGTQTISNSNLTATISGGNKAQTTLAVAANYNSNPTTIGTPTSVVVNGQTLNAVSFNDFRVVNPTATTTVTLYLTVPAGAAANTQAVYFVDGSWVVADPQVRIGNTIIVTLSASSTPTVSQLNGTVFAIAVGAATSSATVGVFPSLASNEMQPAVQASFVSSSSLTLTLTPLQQGSITTSQSSNTGGGDGDSVLDTDIGALWDYFNDFWRWMMIGLDQPPSGKDVDVGGDKPANAGNGAAGTGNKPASTGGATTPQSRNDDVRDAATAPLQSRSNDARDAFFATVLPDAGFSTKVPRFFGPTPALEPPPVTTEEQGYGATALLGLPGLGLMLEEIHQRRASRHWRGSGEPVQPR